MPKKLHKKLAQEAKQKGYTGDRYDAFVYGSMRNIQAKAQKKKRSPYSGHRIS